MSRRIIDLSYPIHEGMTTFPRPWHPVVEISILGRHGIEQRETRKLILGTHTGTHCDAPRHFIPKGATVDSLELETLIGPATVLDFSNASSRQEMTAEDFASKMLDGRPERVVMRFDWCRNWNTTRYYTDHPYLSVEAAEWLLQRQIKLLAMDTPTPDNPRHDPALVVDSPIHRMLLAEGVIIVEYLCNLAQIRAKAVDLVILPLKIVDGDGAPARCVAIEDNLE